MSDEISTEYNKLFKHQPKPNWKQQENMAWCNLRNSEEDVFYMLTILLIKKDKRKVYLQFNFQ